MKISEQDEAISKVIDSLRFPLSIMVVMQHVCPDVIAVGFVDDSVVQFIMRTVTITFAGLAVPFFYMISGYLLFFKSPDSYTWGGVFMQT